jgi:PilZ domain
MNPAALDDDILGILAPAVATPTTATNQTPPFAVQRRWQRFKIDLRIRLFRDPKLDAESVQGQATDASEGGMAIYVPADLTVNEAVRIEVCVPFGKPGVTFQAIVRNCNGFRYGLEFDAKTDEQRKSLLAALISLSPGAMSA